MTAVRRRRRSFRPVTAGRRLTLVIGAALIAVVCTPGPASADPPGPTDYRTEIVAVEPPVDELSFAIIGGDSFVGVTVAPGHELVVVGYRGEDYLRIDADGTVWRNERSPTRWVNEDRYGGTGLPDDADEDAEPDWRRVGSDGTWAWHDHRTHWMNSGRPPAADPGDVVLEAVVPLIVDGAPVSLSVRSVWVPAPSLVPPVAGAVVALALVLVATRRWGRAVAGAPAVVLAATAAFASGFVAYRSVPAITGPSPLYWALPALALVLAGSAVGLRVRAARPARRVTPTRSDIARKAPAAGAVVTSIAALQLAIWAWWRREALVRAIVPTDAPGGLDRFVIAAAAVVAAIALVQAVVEVATPPAPES